MRDAVSVISEDLRVIFLLPVGLFIGLALNARISQKTGFTHQKQRIAICVCLAFFISSLTLLLDDRGSLAIIWKASPVFYTFVYATFSVFLLVITLGLFYWKLRPSLWSKME